MKRERKPSASDDTTHINRIKIMLFFALSALFFVISHYATFLDPFWLDMFYYLGIELGPLGLLLLFLETIQNRAKDKEFLEEVERRIGNTIIPTFEGKIEDVLNNYGFTSEVTRTVGFREMYIIGTSIIHQTEKRLLIIQKTSSLLFGPRQGDKDEVDFYNSFTEWISDFQENPKKNECIHMFCGNSTRKAIENWDDKKITVTKEIIKNRIKKYKQIEESSNGKFRLAAIFSPFSGPIEIGDNMFVIWVGGEDKYCSISHTNKKFADELFNICKGMIGGDQLHTEDLIAKLGLD